MVNNNMKKEKDEIPIIFIDKIDVPFEIEIKEIQIDNQGKVKIYNHSQKQKANQQIIMEHMKGQNKYEK